MNIKFVILALLVFASAVTGTTLALAGSAPLSLHAARKATVLDDLLLQPLGDPIDGGPPHPN